MIGERTLIRVIVLGIIAIFASVFFGLLSGAHAVEMPRAALRYQAELTREARYAFGLDAPVPVFGAQIQQESGYDPNAKSAFASGLAQFTPQTADWISGVYKHLGPAAPTDPHWAVRAMVTYDKRLHDGVARYDSICDRWEFALSDYNGGAGYRIRRQRLSPMPGSYAVAGKINPGISASNQHQNETYGPRIMYVLQPIYAGWGTMVPCK